MRQWQERFWKNLSFHLFNKMLATGLLKVDLTCSMDFSSIPILFNVLIMKGCWTLSNILLSTIQRIVFFGFCFLFYLDGIYIYIEAVFHLWDKSSFLMHYSTQFARIQFNVLVATFIRGISQRFLFFTFLSFTSPITRIIARAQCKH